MSETGRAAHDGSTARPLRALDDAERRRVRERAGRYTAAMFIAGGLVCSILIATAIVRSPWALLPFACLVPAVLLGPLVIRRIAHPEYVEIALSLIVTIAMAVAAALTGGTSSPLVFLFPIGVAMNALRAGPASVISCAAVTGATFLGACLLHDPGAVTAEPLPMLAVLAMQAGVTVASLYLAEAEIGHRRASNIDPLTGLLNRQGLQERFEELRRQALVSGDPLTLILFDLDLFKAVNDVHGHETGDRLLREVADEARARLRKFELIYRIGGEEFLVLLPDTSEWEGEDVAEQLRLGVISVGVRMGIDVTASFGVSSGTGAEVDFGELFRRADAALYRAKREGRDRVAASDPLALTSTHRARGSRVSRVSA
jgi:diguanylate cyclase (GGDEF)-like protein